MRRQRAMLARRHVKQPQHRIVVDGIAFGILHIHRRAGAVAYQQRAVLVAHQVRTGWHGHQHLIMAGDRIEAADLAIGSRLVVGDIDQRRSVRHPEFMGAAFTLGMIFDFAHIGAVFIDQPHARVDAIVRTFVAEGDGMVVKRTVDGMSQPQTLFKDGLRLAGLQIDPQQTAVRFLFKEGLKYLPVAERLPARRSISMPTSWCSRCWRPMCRSRPMLPARYRRRVLPESANRRSATGVRFHIEQKSIVRREEAAKRIIARAFRQLRCLLFL